MTEHTTPSNTPIPTPVMTPPPVSEAAQKCEGGASASAKTEAAETAKTANAAKNSNAAKVAKTADSSATASERASALTDSITEEDFTSLMNGRFKHLIDARIKSELEEASAESAAVSSDESDLEASAPEANADRGRTEKTRADLAARRRLSSWLREAAQAKENYPGFDLSRELHGKSGARFRALIRSGVDMSTAYEVVHSREIIPAAIRAAAREIEDKITGGVISGSIRPAENALGGGGTLPAMLGIGVSHMSRADRDDIARRAARGEVIRL